MGSMASQITSLITIVYSTVHSGANQRKHQSSASLAFVWGIHRWPLNSPQKGPGMRKMFLFDNVIMVCTKSHKLYTLFVLYYQMSRRLPAFQYIASSRQIWLMSSSGRWIWCFLWIQDHVMVWNWHWISNNIITAPVTTQMLGWRWVATASHNSRHIHRYA